MFDSGDVVYYGNGGWSDSKFWTILEWELVHAGERFAGEVVDPFSLQTVLVW